jgi:hypothetical protein
MKKKAFRKYFLNYLLIMGLVLFSISGVKVVYADEKEKPCPKPYINSLLPKAAKPGEKIKIRGNRFGEKQGSVTFAPGIKSSIIKWMNKRIWVIVPQGARTGPIFVTSYCGKTSNKVHFYTKDAK